MKLLKQTATSVAIAITATFSTFELPATAFTILPLGDSLTRGYPYEPGYRNFLFDKLQSAGLDVEFVGSQDNFPPLHEGTNGLKIDDIASLKCGVLPCNKDQMTGLSPWKKFSPDVILLMAGTNNFRHFKAGTYDAKTAKKSFTNLITTIRHDLPEVELLVASIPFIDLNSPHPVDYRGEPISHETLNAKITTYNRAVRTLASKSDKVRFVDVNRLLDFAELVDGVHPSKEGYQEIADAWFGQIAFLKKDLLNITEDLIVSGDVKKDNRVNVQDAKLQIHGNYTQTAGTTTLNDGKLMADLVVIEDGSLLGSGNIDARVVGLRDGTISAGTEASAGKLTIGGSLVLTEKAELNVEIGGFNPGIDYDRIDVDKAYLFGQLNVNFLEGFDYKLVSPFDTFEVLTGNSIAFDSRFVNMNGGGRTNPFYLENDLFGQFKAFFVASDGTRYPASHNFSRKGITLTKLVLTDFQTVPGSVVRQPEPGVVMGLLAFSALSVGNRLKRKGQRKVLADRCHRS